MAWAISVAGMAMSAYSTIQEGRQAREMGIAQQEAYEGEAQAVVQTGFEESRLKREEGKEFIASQIALVSATGGGMVGSNLVVMAESARRIEVDASTIERNALTRAKFLRTRGAFARYEGELAKYNAPMRALAGGAKSAGQLYGMYKSGGNNRSPKLSAENRATLYGGRY